MSFIIKFKGKSYLAIFKLQIMVNFEIFTKQTINFFNKSSINKNMLQKHISKRHINIDKKLFFS